MKHVYEVIYKESKTGGSEIKLNAEYVNSYPRMNSRK